MTMNKLNIFFKFVFLFFLSFLSQILFDFYDPIILLKLTLDRLLVKTLLFFLGTFLKIM